MPESLANGHIMLNAGELACPPPSEKTLRKVLREEGLFPPQGPQPGPQPPLPADIARDQAQLELEDRIHAKINEDLRLHATMRTYLQPRRN